VVKQYSSLRAYLKATRRTQEQLAAELGVRQGLVSKWVRGAQMPRPSMALRLSRLTGVPVEAMTQARANHRRVAA
jgi:transcriptional regulator with XRE-family HTH domain